MWDVVLTLMFFPLTSLTSSPPAESFLASLLTKSSKMWVTDLKAQTPILRPILSDRHVNSLLSVTLTETKMFEGHVSLRERLLVITVTSSDMVKWQKAQSFMSLSIREKKKTPLHHP